ncbi:MAG: RNA polymerase sigma-70 factor [Ferruginibacter sp.]
MATIALPPLMSKKQFPDANTITELQHRIADFDDAVAYKTLFFHFFLPLKSFSIAILKSNELAEEVVSDIFLEIWVRRKQLPQVEDLKMYLYISVRNASLRKLQQLQKTSTLSLDDMQVDFASPDPDAVTNIVTHELSDKIAAAIDQLPQQCKIIFKLAKEDKLKYKEIAQMLNISVKTIDNQISIALKKIASVLQVPVRSSNKK